SNCETANISKTVNASVEQMEAIRYLEDTGELYMLPAELVSAAMLRKINPDSSLNELCKRSCEPITRSGLNHRLQKIVAIAKIVRQEEV
ncbi:MAG: DNA-binding protein WhiA, partial [Oscillospiraceae bacterium]